MDEKYKSNLLGFLQKDQEAWENIWSEDAQWDKGEIISCCSSHALDMFVALIDPKNDGSPSSQKQLRLHLIMMLRKLLRNGLVMTTNIMMILKKFISGV